MQSTSGWSIAASTRSVIAFLEIRNEVWTLAITQSRLAEQLVVVVERAVGQDVHLRAGEDAKAAPPGVQLSHLLDSLAKAVGLHVIAESVAGRVVRDGEVGIAARASRLGHLLEGVVAVGERGVAVKVAPSRHRARPAPEASRRPRRRSRRLPRAAPARCRRARGARTPRPRSRTWPPRRTRPR